MKRDLDAYPLLSRVNSPDDLKQLDEGEALLIIRELRSYITDVVSVSGGHLGASLGVVELTVALHRALDLPRDVLIWDVGHQAYPHKILTGRRDSFLQNRKWNGISGFPKMDESKYDQFGVGHASTSISAGLGRALANKLTGSNQRVVSVIGDASIAGGMAFEALNHAGETDLDFTVILNDNSMSIDPSVGALHNYLLSKHEEGTPWKEEIWSQLAGNSKHESNLFEALNFTYYGPIDGHDFKVIEKVLKQLEGVPGPKLIHCITVKGKGYKPAEQGNATKWHAPGLFDRVTGKILKPEEKGPKPPKYQHVFGQTLKLLADQNKSIVGITPAMPTGSSMSIMMDAYPERCFDVGIAEQHAVTLSAGMATGGLLPYCSIYSTFLQRAYDQVIHDVAIQNIKVIFCLDRAGLVGEDGGTHQGIYDIPFLRCIPNMKIASPLDEHELQDLLYAAQEETYTGPLAIRYPRGRGEHVVWEKAPAYIEPGVARELNSGDEVCVLSTGPIGNRIQEVCAALGERHIQVGHVHFPFIKPLDAAMVETLSKSYKRFVTVEDGAITGGFGSAINELLQEMNRLIPLTRIGVPDEVIEQGTQADQYAHVGLDNKTLYDKIGKLAGNSVK